MRRGCPRAFLARQVPTDGKRRTVAKTDSCGWAARCEIWPYLFLYDGRFLRATNDEPRATIFSRAEGQSRRCRSFECDAAKRHLSPRRPANCGQRSAGRQALNSTNDLRRTALRHGLHFLEIPKYTKLPKKRIRDMTKMERWLAYFANQLIPS